MEDGSSRTPPLRALAFALIVDAAGRVLLVRHNYEGRCYALPGGTVEPGETPQAAVEREIREELCVDARTTRLVSLNSYRGRERVLAHVFQADIVAGVPTLPGTDEIADIGWFAPGQLPQPVYHTVETAIQDALHARYGVLHEIVVDE